MNTQAAPRPAPWLVLAALLAVYVVWGSTYLAIRFALDGYPPLFFPGLRFIAAGGVLYAPNFRASVLHRQVLTPLDLERRFGLTGGNIFQGSMALHQLFSLRPVPGWGDYRTPLPGLYLCGAAAHPGGGVSGAPGRNCAREMLRDG